MLPRDTFNSCPQTRNKKLTSASELKRVKLRDACYRVYQEKSRKREKEKRFADTNHASGVHGLPQRHRSFIIRDVKRGSTPPKTRTLAGSARQRISFTFIGGIVVARTYGSRAAAISVLARQVQRSSARALRHDIKTPIKQPRRVGN